MRAHIITDGKVSNTIVVDSLDVIPGLISAENGGSIGDLWDGVTFTKPPTPPTPIPQAVTMRQARLALLGAGLFAAVDAAVVGMLGAEGDAARIEWEFSSEVKRTQPLVLTLAPTLGLTDVQLDNLFITASTL